MDGRSDDRAATGLSGVPEEGAAVKNRRCLDCIQTVVRETRAYDARVSTTRDLREGEVTYVQGSAATPYALKNIGGVYSCSCPAWRNQSRAIDQRTCKHLKALRGEEVELDRVGEPPAGGSSAARGGGAKAAAVKKDVPPLLLAHRWEPEVDLTGWWMSEKLDGVRAYWDGQRFLSRTGNEYLAPEWFTDGLGAEPLDGELWIGRAAFQETVSVVRRYDKSEHWRRVKYVVFDLPASSAPFEARIDALAARFGDGAHPHTTSLAHERCEGAEHVERRLKEIEGLGGEGLMMRQPGSRYVAGRSPTLLKVKSFLDAEARVLGYLDGKGRHAGRVGALQVELPDGTAFSVGTGLSDAEREAPPEIGAIITFRYFELTPDGVPRFPSYVAVREDFVWPGAPMKGAKAPKAPKVKAAAVEATAVAPGGVRRFELVEGNSAKFWEVAVEGASYTVRYGRIGAAGQAKTKEAASVAAAEAEVAKLVAEKTRKGYVEAI
ncbi:MAG: DNA ligase [Deltaproteobacteria bacterium]|nr:DNA ligase [Deltaproteobacteria bacterium]